MEEDGSGMEGSSGDEEQCGIGGAVWLSWVAFKKRVRKRLKRRKVEVWWSISRVWTGSAVLFYDHAVGQVLGVVFEELCGGSRAVGQLQLLQLMQLNEA